MTTAPAYPTVQDILTTALRAVGATAIGADPNADDNALALTIFNQIIGQKNNRKRVSAFYMTSQAFTIASTKQNYSIGRASDAPDFVVSGVSNERPRRIEFAQLVLTGQSPNIVIQMAVVNIEQYQQITAPTLNSKLPTVLYYQPTWPNGTITLYSEPTTTTNQLNLTWWAQLLRVDIADVSAALTAPDGYDRWLSLLLGVALYIHYPGRVDLQELKTQCREAESDVSSVNVQPPKISTTDGIRSSGGSRFDWQTRSFV